MACDNIADLLLVLSVMAVNWRVSRIERAIDAVRYRSPSNGGKTGG